MQLKDLNLDGIIIVPVPIKWMANTFVSSSIITHAHTHTHMLHSGWEEFPTAIDIGQDHIDAIVKHTETWNLTNELLTIVFKALLNLLASQAVNQTLNTDCIHLFKRLGPLNFLLN